MKERIIKSIRIPVYNGKVTVVLFNKDYKAVNKYLRHKKFDQFLEEDDEGFQYSQIIDNKQRFIIIIKRGKDEVGTIIHELYHLTQSILEYYGVDYRKGDRNEAYAYLLEALSKKVLSIIDNYERTTD